MANFTKTITNSINLFGSKSTNKWGSMVWLTDNWAFGSGELFQSVYKVVSNSISVTDAIAFHLEYLRTIVNSITISDNLLNESLSDSNGYQVFFGSGENALNRPLTSFSASTFSTDTYSQATNPGTDWTEV
jgi:hypothetical protein